MPSRAPIPMRRELVLKASPLDLWPLLSNTNRMNRALGLPVMTLGPPREGEYARNVSARLYGIIPVSWRELPFEWVEGRYYRSVREFDGGPVEHFEGGIEMTPEATGCRMTIRSDFTPRNALGAFLVRYVTGRRAVEDTERLMRRFESCLVQREGEAFPTQRTRGPADALALSQRADVLGKACPGAPAAERLLRHLQRAYDDELSCMRPFELADRWGLDRVETLKVFLHAVKAGLLDMSWEVLCPNCAAPKEKASSLSELREQSHCPSCGIDYGVDFDENVELRFTASPSVRLIETHTFCVGNPSQTPFAVAQLRVLPQEPRACDVDLSAESYSLVDLSARRRLRLRPSREASAEIHADLRRLEDGAQLRFRPGTVRLVLQPAGEERLVRLEKESWREKGAKACQVSCLREFRDLFSTEVLSPGVSISVRTVSILFSDLKGSTALYERVGDAAAYSLVRDHFGYLFEIIERRRGSVVKTIGDAVMASFPRAADAVAAALEMQQRVGELNERLSPKPPVVIKLGVHQGPALAVSANGAPDFFGTAVNVAARVQNESLGGDVVVTAALLEDPSVQELLTPGVRREPFEIALKGLSQAFRLWRLVPEKVAARA